MVEGWTLVAQSDDRLDCTAQILEDGLRRNPQDRETARPQVSIASHVALRSLAHVVCNPVDLDRDPALKTGEVERQLAQWMMAAELVSARTLTKFAPEQRFGEIVRTALALRGLEGAVFGAKDPSTTLRAVPLPVPGRYGFVVLCAHIRNTPNRGASATGAFSAAASARPSTSRV